MKGKRKIKAKAIQHPAISPLTNHHHTHATILTVNEKLAKLRLEHNRAIVNRQRHTIPSTDSQQQTVLDTNTQWAHPWAGLDLETATTAATNHAPLPLERPPGPPPPPSWVVRRQQQQPRIQRLYSYTPSTLHRRHSTVPSLVKYCSQQLVFNRRLHQIRNHIPPHVKQRLLYEWVVTDQTLALFEKADYEELWLESANVSLERLVHAFWRLDVIDPSTEASLELADDWEEEAQDITTLSYVRLDQDQEEIGAWKHLYRIMAILQPTTDPLCSYTLSSPYLGHTLVSLNLSWMKVHPSSLSWLSFAYLMVDTLPYLKWLYTAGTFDSMDGPQVLPVLARGLRKLTLWDLAHHHWLHYDLLSSLDWHLDLTTLCLSPMHQWKRPPWLDRIKIVWIE